MDTNQRQALAGKRRMSKMSAVKIPLILWCPDRKAGSSIPSPLRLSSNSRYKLSADESPNSSSMGG